MIRAMVTIVDVSLRPVLIMGRKRDVIRTTLRFRSSYRPYDGQIVTEHGLSFVLYGYEFNTITWGDLHFVPHVFENVLVLPREDNS